MGSIQEIIKNFAKSGSGFRVEKQESGSSFVAHGRTATRNVDLSRPEYDEYGPLFATFQDLSQQNIDVDPSVLNVVGEKLSSSFQQHYSLFQKRHPQFNDTPLNAFLAENSDVRSSGFHLARELTQSVLSSPIDVSMIAHARLGNTDQTLGRAFPQLSQIQTGKDAQDFLINSTLSGVSSAAAALGATGRNAADMVSSIGIGMLENLPTYERFGAAYTTANGFQSRREQSFLKHLFSGGRSQITEDLRAEKQLRAGDSLGMLDALKGDYSEAPAFTVNSPALDELVRSLSRNSLEPVPGWRVDQVARQFANSPNLAGLPENEKNDVFRSVVGALETAEVLDEFVKPGYLYDLADIAEKQGIFLNRVGVVGGDYDPVIQGNSQVSADPNWIERVANDMDQGVYYPTGLWRKGSGRLTNASGNAPMTYQEVYDLEKSKYLSVELARGNAAPLPFDLRQQKKALNKLGYREVTASSADVRRYAQFATGGEEYAGILKGIRNIGSQIANVDLPTSEALSAIEQFDAYVGARDADEKGHKVLNKYDPYDQIEGPGVLSVTTRDDTRNRLETDTRFINGAHWTLQRNINSLNVTPAEAEQIRAGTMGADRLSQLIKLNDLDYELNETMRKDRKGYTHHRMGQKNIGNNRRIIEGGIYIEDGALGSEQADAVERAMLFGAHEGPVADLATSVINTGDMRVSPKDIAERHGTAESGSLIYKTVRKAEGEAAGITNRLRSIQKDLIQSKQNPQLLEKIDAALAGNEWDRINASQGLLNEYQRSTFSEVSGATPPPPDDPYRDGSTPVRNQRRSRSNRQAVNRVQEARTAAAEYSNQLALPAKGQSSYVERVITPNNPSDPVNPIPLMAPQGTEPMANTNQPNDLIRQALSDRGLSADNPVTRGAVERANTEGDFGEGSRWFRPYQGEKSYPRDGGQQSGIWYTYQKHADGRMYWQDERGGEGAQKQFLESNPNQGKWGYLYNPIGELINQTSEDEFRAANPTFTGSKGSQPDFPVTRAVQAGRGQIASRIEPASGGAPSAEGLPYGELINSINNLSARLSNLGPNAGLPIEEPIDPDNPEIPNHSPEFLSYSKTRPVDPTAPAITPRKIFSLPEIRRFINGNDLGQHYLTHSDAFFNSLGKDRSYDRWVKQQLAASPDISFNELSREKFITQSVASVSKLSKMDLTDFREVNPETGEIIEGREKFRQEYFKAFPMPEEADLKERARLSEETAWKMNQTVELQRQAGVTEGGIINEPLSMAEFLDGNKISDEDRAYGRKTASYSAVRQKMSQKRAALVTSGLKVKSSHIAAYQGALGEGRWDDQTQSTSIVNVEDGTVVGPAMIETAYSEATAAWNRTMGSSLLSADKNDAAATIRGGMNDQANERVAAFKRELRSTGADEQTVKALSSQFKEVFNYYVKEMVDKYRAELSEGYGTQIGDKSIENYTTYNSVKIGSAKQAKTIEAESPEFARQFMERTGMSFSDAVSGGKKFRTFDESTGIAYEGGGGEEGAGFRGRMARGGRGMGAAFYTAYLAKRLWSMTVGPEIVSAEQYAKSYSDVGIGSGEGNAGIGGSNARLNLIDEASRKASYEVFGGFMEGASLFDTQGGGFNRMASYGKAGASVGLYASLGSQMLPQLLPSLFGAGGSMAGMMPIIGPAGMVLGGAIAGTGALFEINNAMHPDKEPVSPASAYRDLVRTYYAEIAFSNYNDTIGLNPIRNLENTKSGFSWEKFGSALASSFVGLPTPPIDLSALQANPDDYDFMFDEDGLLKPGAVGNLTDAQVAQVYGMRPTPHQESITNFAGVMAQSSSEDVDKLRSYATTLGGAVGFENLDADLNDQLARYGMRNSVGNDQAIKDSLTYAEQMGNLPGTPEFNQGVREFLSQGTNRTQSYRLSKRAEKVAGLGAQLQSQMAEGVGITGLGARLVNLFNMSPSEVQSTQGMMGNIQSYTGDLTAQDITTLSGASKNLNPYQSQAISNMSSSLSMAGFSGAAIANFASAFGDAGFSNQQTDMFSRIMGGDWQAASHLSWQNGANTNMRFWDQYGRDMFQVSGALSYNTLRQWQGSDSLLGQAVGGLNFGSQNAFSSSLLGTNNQEIISAFNEGGTRGISILGMQKSAQISAAGAGLAMQGIQMQRAHLWGSGSWDNPAPGSMYALEDQQIALQWQSQQSQFAESKERMERSNYYGEQRESNSWQRMQTTNAYNQWNMGMNYQQMQQRQAWGMQDWQYQDQTRSLNLSWQMEDLDEAIRFSSGRDRRKLETQKERLGVSTNLEGEQIDTQRERQQELWAAEEERYNKQKEYQDELMALDKESFDIGSSQRKEFYALDTESYNRRVEEANKQKELQDEINRKQREYQAAQLDLQEKSAGLQAASAYWQNEIAEAMKNAEDPITKISGAVEEMTKYDKSVNVLEAFNAMLAEAQGTNVSVITALSQLMSAISGTPLGKVRGLINRVEDINKYGG